MVLPFAGVARPIEINRDAVRRRGDVAACCAHHACHLCYGFFLEAEQHEERARLGICGLSIQNHPERLLGFVLV